MCVCVRAGVCLAWTVPSAATGASTATCVPMTPPAVPSRRDESTPPRLVEHTHATFSFVALSPSLHLFLSPALSDPPHPPLCFLLPASCSVFQLCVSLGACLQKDSPSKLFYFRIGVSHSGLLFSAVAINTLLSMELLSSARLNNDTGSLWPDQSSAVDTSSLSYAALCWFFPPAMQTDTVW